MNIQHEKSKRMDALLWSIALPGFGQLRNGQFLKALIFIALEILINNNAHLNTVIYLTFHGEITSAIAATNYQWLLFYPCVYLFAAWDAYAGAGGGQTPFAFLPFVLGAYIGTIGVIFSSTFSVAGIMPGPVWGPISFILLGVVLGILGQKLLCHFYKTK